MAITFTSDELAYLDSQRLGRLATVDADGAPQNNPVGYAYDAAKGVFTIGGFRMGATRKFHNVQGNPHVAFVIDDLKSIDPWEVRCLEIRGTAVALHDATPPEPFMTSDVIEITPNWVLSFGINADEQGPVGVRRSDA